MAFFLWFNEKSGLGIIAAFSGAFKAGEVEYFDFLSCSGSLAEKFQAGQDRGVTGEAADFDIFTEFSQP